MIVLEKQQQIDKQNEAIASFMDEFDEIEEIIVPRRAIRPQNKYKLKMGEADWQPTGAEQYALQKLSKNREFKFSDHFDKKGALYHLGTKGNKRVYRNPAADVDKKVEMNSFRTELQFSTITASASSMQSGSVKDVIDIRKKTNFCTKNE